MGNRGLFRGYALNAIDAKGRVAIPSGFRKTIESNSNESFLVISKHDRAPCLTGYDRDYANALQLRIDEDERHARTIGQDFDLDNATRKAFGVVDDVSFDASGRFIMPGYFRRSAKLDDWALFLARGHVFEMWNPHMLIAHDGVDAAVKDMARHICAERGVVV